MLRAEPAYAEAEAQLIAKIEALAAGPDAPPDDGSQDALRSFLYWAMWRDPELLERLAAYARVAEQAARRHGVSFSLDVWLERLPGGGGGLNWWKRQLDWWSRRVRELEIEAPTGGHDWCGVCGSSRWGPSRCRCRYF